MCIRDSCRINRCGQRPQGMHRTPADHRRLAAAGEAVAPPAARRTVPGRQFRGREVVDGLLQGTVFPQAAESAAQVGQEGARGGDAVAHLDEDPRAVAPRLPQVVYLSLIHI